MFFSERVYISFALQVIGFAFAAGDRGAGAPPPTGACASAGAHARPAIIKPIKIFIGNPRTIAQPELNHRVHAALCQTECRLRLDFTPAPERHFTHCCNTRSALTDGATSRASLTLESTLASVHTVEETALDFAHTAGFTPDTASNLAMVAREAAVNAVIHGNQYDAERHMTASFEITAAALIIKIADQGEGLDPASIPDPLAPENLLRSSGRGVFLMRAFMDEVSFRDLHPGTEITLIKRRV